MGGMRQDRVSIRSIAVCLLLAACGAEGAKKAEPTTKTTFDCRIQVAKKKIGPVKGEGNGDSEAKAEEAAWTNVCNALPGAVRDGCRDDKKFSVQKSTGSASANGGPTNYSVTLTLESIEPEFSGEGSSEASKDEACAAAIADACGKAGEKGDCVAAGGFEKRGESMSKTVKRG